MNVGFQVLFKIKHYAGSTLSLGKFSCDLNIKEKHHCKHWFLTLARSQQMLVPPPSPTICFTKMILID